MRALLLAPFLLAPPALAHDFWLEPEAWVAEPGTLLTVNAVVGHAGDNKVYDHDPRHIERFVLVSSAAEPASFAGEFGKPPTGRVEIPAGAPRYDLASYLSQARTVDLEPAKFENYLREEGLDWVVEDRRARGESEANGRESYVRCAKALIRVGEAASEGWDRVQGLPAELTPLSAPHACEQTEEGLWKIALRLDVQGQPSPQALVEAMPLDGSLESVTIRTDERGVARFELPREGAWYFAAVHMVRKDGGDEQDWHSWWANLSMELSAPAK